MKASRIILLFILIVLVGSFFVFDLGQYLTLSAIKEQQQAASQLFEQQPLLVSGLFFIGYVLVTGLSLPGAAIMTLLAGAVFGLGWGTLIVSFASSLGATLAFLFARFLLRDWVLGKFGESLRSINQGIDRDGAFYLFTLRLVPVFPFFIINLVMGLTTIRVLTFYWVSQLGMLAGTLVYVNAGTQLAAVESLADIGSPQLLLSFVLLGLFPWLARGILGMIKKRRVYRGFGRPNKFDVNVAVIGAGSAGLVAAYIAAAVRARVTLIEKHRMGGDCLNTGCVPSKALIRSARFLADAGKARQLGFKSVTVDFDFADVMARVRRVIERIEPHDSVQRYQGLGVECLQGEAEIETPWRIRVGDRRLTARSIIIATGARPFVPPIPGLDKVGYLTSDTLWEMTELPKRLVILGGGPIGCELTQAFARFGCQITQVEMLPRLMVREDPEVSELIMARFREQGIQVRTGYRADRFRLENGEKLLTCTSDEGAIDVSFDQVLVAVGRVANTTGFGLEALGIPLSRLQTIEVNDYLQTRFADIYATGDVAGPYQFTHTAAYQSWFASVNALFSGIKKFKVDYSVIPWATFTDPEVARVGLNEQEAREKGIDYEVTRYELDDLDRAIADEAAEGFVKVLTAPGKDRILGVTIVGGHAGDLLAEFVLAMRHGLGLNKILSTIHVYPTWAEANKFAAGVWKKNHASEKLLQRLAHFHAWRRGDGSFWEILTGS